MEDKKQAVVKWIKTHKIQLLIVGISVPTVIALVLGLKNKDTIVKLWGDIQEKIKKANLYSNKWFENA